MCPTGDPEVVIDKEEAVALAELDGWGIARRFRCGYSGQPKPISDGGFFYDRRRWVEDGGCTIVAFGIDPEADTLTLVVKRGRLNRPSDPEKLRLAFARIGRQPTDSIDAEINAVRAHFGYEPDGSSYPDIMTFKLYEWKDWRIWLSVADWLNALGE